MNSSDFRHRAWSKLSGNWGGPIAVVLIQMLLIGVVSGISSGIGTIIVVGPLLVGVSGYFVNFALSKNPRFEDMFDGFKNCFGNSIVLYLLTMLFTFLWSLLLIIPGIIKQYAYSMAPYIMAENPMMTATEALDESQRIMKGHKMDLFILQLSFIGWFLLVIITFGIALIWVAPYIEAARAEFYLEISGGNETPVDTNDVLVDKSEDSFDAFLK